MSTIKDSNLCHIKLPILIANALDISSDELLIDCLQHSMVAINAEFARIKRNSRLIQSYVQLVSVSHRNDLLISWRLAQLIIGFSLRETY